MVLSRLSDGSYGRYVPGLGWVPIVAAAISALPAVLDILNPKPPPAPPPPPPVNNTPLIVGAAVGGFVVLGGLGYLALRKKG